MENLHETLDKRTSSSALALKDLLGTIRLEPISEESEDFYGIIDNLEIASAPAAPRNDERGGPFKPYYVAHTKIRPLALLDDRCKGSNWSRWWRWRELNSRPRFATWKCLHV